MPLPVLSSLPRYLCALVLLLALHSPLLSPTPAIAADLSPVRERNSQTLKPYLDQAIERVTEFQLDNGLKFIVMENNEAPVVSFYTYFDVGGVDEPVGKTGVAHFLEHMAFKGTERIGTKDFAQEQKLLDQLDEVFGQITQARAKGDKEAEAKLEEKFKQIQQQAQSLVQQNEFGQIIQMAGGVGLNAATSADATFYFYSLPANKLELWMSLESERFLEPVFREFYQEQEVILEERRMRTENNPVGQMVEEFLDTAFTKHPYRRPVIGYDEDIRNLSRQDVTDFYEKYYTPGNMTIAVVGDVKANQVKSLAQKYFGRFPKRPPTPQVTVVEPPQTEQKEINLTLPSQPWYFEGYHSPAFDDPDSAVFDVMTTILSSGRTSRLYQSLVEEQQLALMAQGFNGFPADKFPNLLMFYAQSAPGRSLDELSQALHGEIERLKTEPVTQEELERAQNLLQISALQSLNSNMGMAQLLVKYNVRTGDWRNLFARLEAIAAVTPEDIQRVAQATFRPENSTIGRILPESPNP
ncbi:M16 family metallopeptidase [Synechocystis salina]|uniref:Insulinase family protein n=1 Tax=Synechocystis salina LEGE 00031 TaxID=1828736 RepID=A0ABR9VVW6_9SYNC|nr:pitrilysin family protein [Synechocystis salina]MBE9242781.1 insulinase family protein [Synechocystis salina LEGE 00041]MBE9255502.1 insulinase family protein [Synechocystis salina LEGE 00031]